MRIAIIGSGNIGAGLGRAWAVKGHAVVFGARDPADPELAALLSETGATAETVSEAAASADLVVLALPFSAVPSLVRALPDWTGRIVIDCTNPIGPGFTLLHGHTDSGAEVVARQLPGARVVKSFNAQGAENLANPVYDGTRATNFYCGDDAAAKATVRELIADVGFEPVDVGGLAAARYLEPMTMLWIGTSRVLGSRQLAFKLLRR